MDFAHRVRLRQREQIVVAAHVALPVLEAGIAEGGFVEPALLQHGAHAAVEQQNALGGEGAEVGFGFGDWCGHEHYSVPSPSNPACPGCLV